MSWQRNVVKEWLGINYLTIGAQYLDNHFILLNITIMYSLSTVFGTFTTVILALLVVFIGVSLGYYIVKGAILEAKRFMNYLTGNKNN